MTPRNDVATMQVLLAGVGTSTFVQIPPAAPPPLGTPMPYIAIHQPEFVAASEATFLQDDDILLDLGTHSTWNAYGLCLEGPLKGTQLKQLILVPQFWFAWSQFHQGTRIFAAR